MSFTTADLMQKFEDAVFARIIVETPYYASNPEQTKATWFMKRINKPTEYHSVGVQQMFVSFVDGFKAAGGMVHGEA